MTTISIHRVTRIQSFRSYESAFSRIIITTESGDNFEIDLYQDGDMSLEIETTNDRFGDSI